MNIHQLADGTVHNLPNDLKKAILADQKMLEMWQDITPLARNEWICWVEEAKRPKRALEELKLANPKCILACADHAAGRAVRIDLAKNLGSRSNFIFLQLL